jgi:hypothetical protein
MPGVNFRSSHFQDVPNYVAHLRTAELRGLRPHVDPGNPGQAETDNTIAHLVATTLRSPRLGTFAELTLSLEGGHFRYAPCDRNEEHPVVVEPRDKGRNRGGCRCSKPARPHIQGHQRYSPVR